MNNLFLLASYLTDPICKAREYYWLGKITGEVSWLRVFWYMSTGIILAPLGIMIRGIAQIVQKSPYLLLQGEVSPKILEGSFSILSWNVCCIPAGYSITDGGVTPWRERIEVIIQKICDQDADIVCLTEVFDMHAAQNIVDRLKKHYAYLYYNIGPEAVGVPSGFLVASKVHIKDTEFIRFPTEHLVGRTKHAVKGVFGFTLATHQKEVVIFLTHLQHSEECEFPTHEEVFAREGQMEIIFDQVDRLKNNEQVILTGDLNLDEDELKNASWVQRTDRGVIPVEKTWGGDEFCARLVGKRASSGRTYDYTMILDDTDTVMSTTSIETGFDASFFKEGALSDHLGLLTIISLKGSD